MPKRSHRRSLGPKGQVVVPKEIRDYLGVGPGAALEFVVRDREVIIEAAESPQAYLDQLFALVKRKSRTKTDVDEIYEKALEEEHGISRRKRVRLRNSR